jgi:cellulose synthase/poly-beta-1,6-N-acetylglucosamine synthase-like glycosyltransferase
MKKTFKAKTTDVLILTSLYIVTVGLFYLTVTRSYHPVARFDQIRLIMLVLMFPLLVKYVLQLMCMPLYSLVDKYQKPSGMAAWTPSVSVLIPAWNEEVGIVKTIKSVLDTQYPRLQIVVINDGSTDGTHEKVTGFIADHKFEGGLGARLDYIKVPNGGKAKALNRALIEADGEIIITVDADSIMDPGAITNLVKRFRHPGVGAVAGQVVVGNRRKPIEWMQEMEYLYGFFFKRADSLFNSVYIIGGAAAAYRRKVLQEMGGFDNDIITEDIEMSTRILKCGYKTRYAADAIVYTECPSDLKGLCNQRLRWKYGRILTFIKHRKLFFSVGSKHHPYLTFLLLPMAVYAEFLLLLEPFMLASFFMYTVLTSDYMPLAFVVAMLATVFSLQVLADSKHRFHSKLILLAPVVWLVFYAVDMIEVQALFRSLKRLATRKELKWQRWVRVGIQNN